MIKPLKVEINLIRERFKIYGLFNILSLFIVLMIILSGIKSILFFLPDTFSVYMILSMILVITGATKIYSEKISLGEQKMRAFFPDIKMSTIKKYFLYKKPAIIYLLIIFLFLPINSSNENYSILAFFFFILMTLTLINTLLFKIATQQKKNSDTSVFVRLGYPLLIVLYNNSNINFNLRDFAINHNIFLWLTGGIFLALLNIILLDRPQRKENKDG